MLALRERSAVLGQRRGLPYAPSTIDWRLPKVPAYVISALPGPLSVTSVTMMIARIKCPTTGHHPSSGTAGQLSPREQLFPSSDSLRLAEADSPCPGHSIIDDTLHTLQYRTKYSVKRLVIIVYLFGWK